MEIHFVHYANETGCQEVTNKISVLGIFVETDPLSYNAYIDIMAKTDEEMVYENFNLM
jgi:hypothetical protein